MSMIKDIEVIQTALAWSDLLSAPLDEGIEACRRLEDAMSSRQVKQQQAEVEAKQQAEAERQVEIKNSIVSHTGLGFALQSNGLPYAETPMSNPKMYQTRYQFIVSTVLNPSTKCLAMYGAAGIPHCESARKSKMNPYKLNGAEYRDAVALCIVGYTSRLCVRQTVYLMTDISRILMGINAAPCLARPKKRKRC